MTLAGVPHDDHPTIKFRIGDIPADPAKADPPGRHRITALGISGALAAIGLASDTAATAAGWSGNPFAAAVAILSIAATLTTAWLACKQWRAMQNRITGLERALRLAEIRLEATLLTEGRQLRQQMDGIKHLLGQLPDRMNEYADAKVTDAGADAAIAAYRATGTDGRRPRGVASVSRLRAIDPN